MNFLDSIKTIDKQINHDLKYLSNWFNIKKVVLNISETRS